MPPAHSESHLLLVNSSARPLRRGEIHCGPGAAPGDHREYPSRLWQDPPCRRRSPDGLDGLPSRPERSRTNSRRSPWRSLRSPRISLRSPWISLRSRRISRRSWRNSCLSGPVIVPSAASTGAAAIASAAASTPVAQSDFPLIIPKSPCFLKFRCGLMPLDAPMPRRFTRSVP